MANKTATTDKNIIQQGVEAKFTININRKDFDMESEDFYVILHYGMNNQSIVIPKNDMCMASSGGFAFSFDTSEMIGRVMAECVYEVPDNDMPDGNRIKHCRQYICFVSTLPLPMVVCMQPLSTEGEVVYKMTDESDLSDKYLFLSDSRGRFLITDDDEFILILKHNE